MTKHSTESDALLQSKGEDTGPDGHNRKETASPSPGQQTGSAHQSEVWRLSLRFTPQRIPVCGSQMVNLDGPQEAASFCGRGGGGCSICCMEPWVSRERETAGVGGWQEVVDVGA